MEKAFTFEQWKLLCDQATYRDEDARLEVMFKEARQGMIPAENAVVINWSEAPEDAIGLELRWDFGGMSEYYSTVERPKPVWVPQVGEAVFVNWGSSTVVCRYLGLDDGQEMVIAPNGDTTMIYSKERKPFHESHIGKKWSEIPS